MSIRLPILIFFSLLITSCSTTRIDQEVNAAYSIKDGESIVVYRDRSEDEVRDIYYSYKKDNKWIYM